MQIAIIQTEAADFVKMYICVLKTFGHDCLSTFLFIEICEKLIFFAQNLASYYL